MAAPPVKNTVAKGKATAKKKSFLTGPKGLLFLIIFSVGAILMLPTTIVFVVAMVPCAVAAFTDTHKEKTAALTIGAMNVAGALPAFLNIWQGGHTMARAIETIAQPMMLLYMYGGAAIGAMIFVYVPPIVVNIMKRQARSKLADFQKEQERLIDVWGPSVASRPAAGDIGERSGQE